MTRTDRLAEYVIAALLTAIALALGPLRLLLIARSSAPSIRDISMTVAMDTFLLVIVGAILALGRYRQFFFHLMVWTFPIAMLAGFEEIAGLTHLAERIAPISDLSLLDKKGKGWPEHLLSDDRWAPVDQGQKLYRPWAGDGIFINELGLRTALPTPKSADEWRVAISGGSAVWGSRVLDADTIPADIQRLLQHTHPRITVFNFGIEGATLGAEITTLQRFRELYAIDEVLFYTGANDVFAAYLSETGANGKLDKFIAEAAGFELVKAARRLSAVLKGPSPTAVVEFERHLLPRILQNSSLRQGMIAADKYCRAAALRCEFALQPTLVTRKNRVAPETKMTRTFELVFPGLAALTEAMYRDTIAAGPGDRVYDLSNIFEREGRPFFVDDVHVSEDGNRVIAEALLPILLRGAR